MISILIVEDQTMLCESLEYVIVEQDDIEVAGSTTATFGIRQISPGSILKSSLYCPQDV